MNRSLKNKLKLLAGVTLLQLMTITTADDTELFQAEQSSERKPNLLFVMDASGSMDKKMDLNDASSKTRLETMQSALRTVLKSAPKNLNVGLMEYGELKQDYATGQYPSGISFPVSDIDDFALPIVKDSILDGAGYPQWWMSKTPKPTATRTVREYIADITDYYFKDSWYGKVYQGKSESHIEMERYGNTPIVDALYEAARYFRGEQLYFGHRDASHHKAKWNGIGRAAHPSTYEGAPVEWDDNLCGYDKYDKDWKFSWENFSESQYPKRWGSSGTRWSSSSKCAVDITNANAEVPTAAACKINEQCTEKQSGGKAYVPMHNHYKWECPVAKVLDPTDENGGMICPVPKEKIFKYKHDHKKKDPKKYWRCKIPRCYGALTRHPDYISPIKNSCQSNFIVLMSDGKPQYSKKYDQHGNRDGTNTKGIFASRLDNGQWWLGPEDKTNPSIRFKKGDCKNFPSGYASGKCGPELTDFLANKDQKGGPGFDGKQTISTFAIGFGLDANEPKADEYLESLVTTDVDPDTGRKHGYFVAQDEVSLADAFGDIVKKIGETTDALAASGYSVNVKNGVSHENTIYIPVFRRKETPTWTGNLKKFKIQVVDGKRKIVDKNGKVAMSELGVFLPDTQDFWSSTADGAKVEAGGVGNLLKDADTRKLLTNSAVGNALEDIKISNSRINYSTLGLDGADKTPEHRAELIRFIRGEKFSTDKNGYVQRKHMGDMMHSDPAVVTYDENFESSGKKGGQVLYIGTNEGYLHAFDTITGEELFAFMPELLLKNIDRQYKNINTDKHVYGVDGPITVWNKLDPHDATKNKHYIYFGLRRGGRAYYALDVTNPLSPKLMWKLNRHTTYGGQKVFGKIGQSWSKATVANIRKNEKGEMRPVVVFSGGYDINNDLYADKTLNPFKKDSTTVRQERKLVDNIGKDIYIVDAEKGPKEYSWSMSKKAKDANLIKHSIPGGVRLVDLNRDGAVDRMYFADMGGNVWRMEMPIYDIDKTGDDAPKLIKFADLGDGGAAIEGRKFYTVPDIALLKYKGKSYLSVSIGSGYRSHPLYEKGTKNNFFMLIDKAVYSDLDTSAASANRFKTIKSGKLEKLKATISGGAFNLSTGRLTKDKNIMNLMAVDQNIRGWALELPSKGEKVLATSITRNGSLVFTTLAPNTEGEGLGKGIPATQKAEQCGAPRSQGRAYVLDILTAQASQDVNEDGDKKESGIIAGVVTTPGSGTGGTDIMSTVTDNTIPNTPQPVYIEPVCDAATRKCTQTVDIRIDKKSSALLPEPLDYLEPRYWSDPVKEDSF